MFFLLKKMIDFEGVVIKNKFFGEEVVDVEKEIKK